MRFLAKLVAGVLIAVFFAAVLVWLVFIPSAKEPGYEMIAMWGTKGTGPGQFNDPTGIAIAGNEVFVADSRNNRIQVFDLDGRFLRQFGTAGTGMGQLGRPMNLTIRDGRLYVPEYFNDRIQVFKTDGTSQRIIGSPGSHPGQFNAPGGVAVSADGSIFVADFYNQRVQKLSRDGSFIRQWGVTGKWGRWAGQFGYPTDVAVSDNGSLYVADGYNDRIQVFDSDGRFAFKWGGPLALNIYGPFNGWFTTVTSVTLDSKGNVFVTDFYNHRVQKFSGKGVFLTSFGVPGSKPGAMRYPMATAVAADGSVFVADFGNNRITRWRQRR